MSERACQDITCNKKQDYAKSIGNMDERSCSLPKVPPSLVTEFNAASHHIYYNWECNPGYSVPSQSFCTFRLWYFCMSDHQLNIKAGNFLLCVDCKTQVLSFSQLSTVELGQLIVNATIYSDLQTIWSLLLSMITIVDTVTNR